jgi:hypothetical protein
MRKPKKLINDAQFWVFDTQMVGQSKGTFSAMGPFDSQAHAEAFIVNMAAQDWINSCGCLREGNKEEWGSDHIIVKEVRYVRPVPPDTVEMTLQDIPRPEV